MIKITFVALLTLATASTVLSAPIDVADVEARESLVYNYKSVSAVV
jgi:hypothetical protein